MIRDAFWNSCNKAVFIFNLPAVPTRGRWRGSSFRSFPWWPPPARLCTRTPRCLSSRSPALPLLLPSHRNAHFMSLKCEGQIYLQTRISAMVMESTGGRVAWKHWSLFVGAHCWLDHLEVFCNETLLCEHVDGSLVAWVWDHRIKGHLLVAGEGHNDNNKDVLRCEYAPTYDKYLQHWYIVIGNCCQYTKTFVLFKSSSALFLALVCLFCELCGFRELYELPWCIVTLL